MKATATSRRLVKTTTVRALDYRSSCWMLLLLSFLVVNAAAMQDFQLTMTPSAEVPVLSSAPVTKAPVTRAPVTKAPVTKAPITKAPVTRAPVTKAPVTKAPVTKAPVSPAPVTAAPVTSAPTNRVTLAPVTKAPVTATPSAVPSLVESESPSTDFPTFAPSKATRPPVTFVPLTLAPVTKAPTTLAPVTNAPVTKAPVTLAPVTLAPVAPPALAVNGSSISVTIATVEGGMKDDEQEVFRATAEAFLSKTLSRIETPIMNVKVQVTDQMVQDVEFRATRALQEASLLVTMFVEGTVTENPEEVDLALLSLQMFDTNGKAFVDDLKATDEDYFKDVKEVMPVNPPDDSAPPSFAPSSSLPPSTVGPTASAVPTTAPTVSVSPSMSNVMTATDRFSVTLFSVTSRMSEETAETFRTNAELFLGTNYALLEQPFTNIQLQVVDQKLQSSSRQRRHLQQTLPLEVTMTIQGDFIPIEGMVTTPEEADLSQTSRNFFDAQADTFVDLLQESDRVEDAVFFANVNDVESVDEAGDVITSPTPAPQSSGGGGGGGGGLAIGAIIAIALCGTLAVSLTAVLVYQHRRKNRAAAAARSGNDRSALRDTSSNNNKKQQQPSSRQQQPSSAGSNLNSNYGDGDSILQSDMQSQMGADTLAGADTMSYAYSLDHGIDPSVASGPQGSDYYAGSNVPMEIPMVGSLGSNIDYDYDDLQSNKTKSNKITRECFAPPGRLGVVIDTTAEGPVVHKVNPGSPLEGIVWPGDIIIAIDDTDTRSLAANDITALMVKNQDQRRKLTILSDA